MEARWKDQAGDIAGILASILLTDRDRRRQAFVKKFAAYADNARAFGFDCFADPLSPSGRLELTAQQADIINQVAAGHDVTWRSSHGVGKTTTLAILTFHWMAMHSRCRVPTTAPTWRQVKDSLWNEIAKWYDRYRFKAFYQLDKTKLALRARPAECFAIGVASNRPENIEGAHSPNLLYLVDEAKGVADRIYDAIDGALTEGGQRLYASTPGSRNGKFYESHHGRISNFFKVVHTSGETAERVSKQWVELKRLEWGVDSPIYIAKVRGEFPQEGDDVLYPLDLIDQAVRSYEETDDDGNPLVKHASNYAIGCDVARFGFNKTVAGGGSSRRLDKLEAWERQPTTETTGRLIAMVRELEASGRKVKLIAIDDSGVGGGVTDQLQEQGVPVDGVLFGGKPKEGEYFANKKAEMAWQFRKAMDENRKAREEGEPGTFALIPNDKLKGQLSSMRRRYGGKGVLSIVDPDDPSIPATELAKGMKVSPDHAHAAILTYYGATEATAVGVGAVVQPPQNRRPANPRRFSNYMFGRGPIG